jgi:hypothetical protein
MKSTGILQALILTATIGSPFLLATAASGNDRRIPDAGDDRPIPSWWENGRETCRGWLDAREGQGADQISDRAWVNGYLTAKMGSAEAMMPTEISVTHWIDDYCRAHERNTLLDAVQRFQPAMHLMHGP